VLKAMLKIIQFALYRIPVLGWFIRDAFEGAPDAEYFFYANVVMLAILGNYLVGQISLVLIAPLIAGVVLLAFKKG
jgi:hypothetical protein